MSTAGSHGHSAAHSAAHSETKRKVDAEQHEDAARALKRSRLSPSVCTVNPKDDRSNSTAVPQVVQVCARHTALDVNADLHVDLTGTLDDAGRHTFVWTLDAEGDGSVQESFFPENPKSKTDAEQFSTLLRVEKFPDSDEGAPDKVQRVVDTMVWCMKQVSAPLEETRTDVVVRVNCKSGQNRSAVVACRFAAVVWENAPNAPGPAVYDMFRRLCKSEHYNMDPNDPQGTWPRFGVHGTGWAHAEIDGAAKRGENKYPKNGPRVVYDETHPHAKLWRDSALKTHSTDTQ